MEPVRVLQAKRLEVNDEETLGTFLLGVLAGVVATILVELAYFAWTISKIRL